MNASTPSQPFDPLLAISIRLGTREGESFLSESREALRDQYGSDVEETLCSAVFENDVAKAHALAELLVPGAVLTVDNNSDGSCKVGYENAENGVSGSVKSYGNTSDTSSEVAAVIYAVSSLVDAERRLADAPQPVVQP